ncbi:Group II intron-encoded protein LtrA [Paraliobacillus sp. PM-2]|uniref:group II intron reverse transcriptase/maturase n=1 Tax=Paraliobacillus sp. PM-2 TaxID=1462524 RepID=UPI00061C9EC4|nr:group II intron reverse transcriptase/maturase [Paraliobacillus sp. PM-2]CQR46513.1 Group II intron-encoded protein LtrA [Paraliobacillus sp. PM-2]CQR46577.1 Group II intron-encoded protein LtrA [Paraliobacillus sp. PM-2]
MQKPQTTFKDGCPQENRMESKGIVEVCSISCGETDRRDGVYNLIHKIVGQNNLNRAYKKVKANKGSAGVDGMEVEELYSYLVLNKELLISRITNGSYEPQPVKRVEIDKDDGSKRKLGIPTVIDRFVQQAILQVIEVDIDPSFSESSFGFRPNRSAHDAMKQAKQLYENGYRTVVDIDMKQYFDTVNHDKLMYHVEEHIKDSKVLRLIRKFLMSGVSINGEVYPTEVGCPQGGNLSPILSNIYLDQLDKELEKRGHRFIRYADDCNIYVKTRKAGNRVMNSITNFLENSLKLVVNRQKSEVGSPTKRKFLGFCIHSTKAGVGFRPHHKSKNKFKKKLKQLTKRNRSGSIRQIIKEINEVTTGWINYYGISYMKGYIQSINKWIKRRIRQIIWKRWKKVRTRYKSLIKLKIPKQKAWEWANTRKGYWHIACSHILHRAIKNEILEKVGLKDLNQLLEKTHSNY